MSLSSDTAMSFASRNLTKIMVKVGRKTTNQFTYTGAQQQNNAKAPKRAQNKYVKRGE